MPNKSTDSRTLMPANLRGEYLHNPLGIDTRTPRRLDRGERSERAAASLPWKPAQYGMDNERNTE